jgi:hypothetical protein
LRPMRIGRGCTNTFPIGAGTCGTSRGYSNGYRPCPSAATKTRFPQW